VVSNQGKLFRVADPRAKKPKRDPSALRYLPKRQESNPIVPVPSWEDNGQPIRGKRFQVLQRTDTLYVLYDREASLGADHPTFESLADAIRAFLEVDQRTWE
jgi:hypothetical protein